MSNQIDVNEAMVSTALSLCTNSHFFALTILCTEINDWKHALLLMSQLKHANEPVSNVVQCGRRIVITKYGSI